MDLTLRQIGLDLFRKNPAAPQTLCIEKLILNSDISALSIRADMYGVFDGNQMTSYGFPERQQPMVHGGYQGKPYVPLRAPSIRTYVVL